MTRRRKDALKARKKATRNQNLKTRRKRRKRRKRKPRRKRRKQKPRTAWKSTRSKRRKLTSWKKLQRRKLSKKLTRKTSVSSILHESNTANYHQSNMVLLACWSLLPRVWLCKHGSEKMHRIMWNGIRTKKMEELHSFSRMTKGSGIWKPAGSAVEACNIAEAKCQRSFQDDNRYARSFARVHAVV